MSDNDGRPGERSPERVVYLMPADLETSGGSDQIDLIGLVRLLWRQKGWVVSITAAFTLAAVLYALLATAWYEADVLLAPADNLIVPGADVGFGGIASLAGLTIPDEAAIEPVAVLRSREFARAFIEEHSLLTVLFADEWDADAQAWKSDDPEEWPDIRDAVTYFDEEIRAVEVDPDTGLVTLTIRWTDPDQSAIWANLLIRRLNEMMRTRALTEAETNVEYLQSQLDASNVVSLQQTIGRLLESELQRLMLARGNEEFSFTVIDPAVPPKQPVWPNLVIIVLAGMLLGAFVALAVAYLRATITPGAP